MASNLPDKEGPVKAETKSIFEKAISAITSGVTDSSGGTGKAVEALKKRKEKLDNI